MSRFGALIGPAIVAASILSSAAQAEHKITAPHRQGAPDGIYASSVLVPASCATVYLPGIAAWKYGEKLRDDYGDTETQTIAAIESIKAELMTRGLSLSDVVLFRGTLVADAARGNKVDMAGYTRAYKRYFGSVDQPNKPARATYQGGITVPGLLVEIEVIAAGHC